MKCLDNAFASLVRSESFDGIQYIKSFIESDKESIVNSDTVDFENIVIDKQYPYAAMLLKYYRKTIKEFDDSPIDMLECIHAVELIIDAEENRRRINTERNMCKPVVMPTFPIQGPQYDYNMQLRNDNIDGVPVIMTGDSICTDSINAGDKELEKINKYAGR